MFRLRRLMVLMALAGVGCGPVQPPADGGVDAGIDGGPGVLCVNFPERIDANYTAAKGCWLVLKTPTIAPGVTLTLAPGAKLVFSSETELEISAAQSLQAVGTQDEPIILTGALPVRGFWKGLTLTGTTVASQLDYVTVEYGGDTKADTSAAAIKLTADSRGVRASISHTTMRESEGYGLYLAASAVVPTFVGNVMTKNTLGPAYVDAEVVGRLDSTSTFTGNDKDEIVVPSYRLNSSATWDDLGVPYHLKADLASIGSATLTLKAGVRLIMPPQRRRSPSRALQRSSPRAPSTSLSSSRARRRPAGRGKASPSTRTTPATCCATPSSSTPATPRPTPPRLGSRRRPTAAGCR